MKKRIVIILEGGMVRAILSDFPAVEVVVFDKDAPEGGPEELADIGPGEAAAWNSVPVDVHPGRVAAMYRATVGEEEA